MFIVYNIGMAKKLYKVSEYCKNIREQAGLSANAFAKENGVSHTYIMEIEAGKRDEKVSIAVLLKLIRVYKLTRNDLIQLDIDPYFLNEVDSLASLQRPIASLKESSLKRQISNFIELDLKPEGFVKKEVPLLEKNGKKKYSLNIDKDMNLVPIYDAYGLDKDNKPVYIYVLESITREMSNEEYALLIFKQMIDVIASYEYSAIKDKKITLIFMTSSIRAYRYTDKIASSINRKNINVVARYYDNRRGTK